MTPSCDLLIRSGRVIDAASSFDGPADIAISGGQVSALGPDLAVRARRSLDASGKLVVPGLIDTHVHLSSRSHGEVAHKMLARAGVTTALDLAGPVRGVLEIAARCGAGLTVAALECLVPGETLPRADASGPEVERAVREALQRGGLGVKLHYDAALTPEAKLRVIGCANALGAYVASHCGSTASASDLSGLREDIELAGACRLHLAHVNSYCRGATADATEEALAAVKLLQGAPHLYSEAYLALINGTSGACRGGVPVNLRVRGWLEAGGFAATETGFAEAIHAGHARVQAVIGDEVRLLGGDAGVAVWRSAGTQVPVSFAVNPPLGRVLLAGTKDASGRFAVDALATDGGGVPRNDMAASGWALVELGVLTPLEWVQKTSWTPARVLGLGQKGHLGEGADADLALFDPATRRVATTITGGEVIMHQGVVFGRGSHALTPAEGVEAVRRAGCAPLVHDLRSAGFYTGQGLKA